MRIQKVIFVSVLTLFMTIACKNDEKKTDKIAKTEKVSLHISGMTCEIGCAKTIESKLAKKEGVSSAKVVFADSTATIEYDANKLDKSDLISFIDGIAGGGMYKSSEAKTPKTN